MGDRKGLNTFGCAIILFVIFACVVVPIYALYMQFFTSTPVITIDTAPQLASAYRGTLQQTQGNQNAVFTLSSITESKATLFNSGGDMGGTATFAPALVASGHFTGKVNHDNTLQFTIGSFLFKGIVHSMKSLSGEYGKETKNPKDGTVTFSALGTWKLTATP